MHHPIGFIVGTDIFSMNLLFPSPFWQMRTMHEHHLFLCQYTLVISKQTGLHRNRQATWGRMPSLSNSRTPTLLRAHKPVRVFHNFDVVLGGPLLSLRGFPKSLKILSSWEFIENLNHLMYKTQNTKHKPQKQPFVYDHALQTKQSWYLLLVLT